MTLSEIGGEGMHEKFTGETLAHYNNKESEIDISKGTKKIHRWKGIIMAINFKCKFMISCIYNQIQWNRKGTKKKPDN